MTERDYVGFTLWFLAFMIAVGGMLPAVWPGLIRWVDRATARQAREPDAHY
ncbi:MAG: hypothetical protein QN183_02890 [Armatimonadota bacterium]|nr:hypothetical protein [Armatimonadota bacterium]MDR7532371.1 hypothetical protein [Armatimonadota bacterium]MDR7535298.1 hypothetical protein [Armatimonadota bacterium]